jgi:hypothetical protein
MIFDVEFENEISNPVLIANFYRGSQLCAYGLAPGKAPLTTGIRASFEVNIITLFDVGKPPVCPLPAETTRTVVQLSERCCRATPLLTQEFVQTYTFAER